MIENVNTLRNSGGGGSITAMLCFQIVNLMKTQILRC